MPWVERVVGFGLLLGPLAYALTLEPQVVEVVEVVEVAPAPVERPAMEGLPVIPVEAAPVRVPTLAPVQSPEPTPEPIADDRLAFAFVNSAGLVLSNEASPAWGTGRLRDHDGPGEFRAAKRADGARVPATLWAQRGRTFDLYDAEGRVCTARLGDMYVLAQHDGPSLYELFEDPERGGFDYDAFDEDDVDAREIRKQVWHLAQDQSPWLVADLIPQEGSCEGALWARDHELPAPTLLHRTDEPTPTGERRVQLLRDSDELAQTKADHAEWYAGLEADDREYHDDWAKIEQDHPAQTKTWLDADGQPRLVELTFGQAGEGCGEGHDSTISALDEVTADGFLPTTHSVDPLAIFDLDRDGQWELLYADGSEGASLLVDHTGLVDSIVIEMGFVCPC